MKKNHQIRLAAPADKKLSLAALEKELKRAADKKQADNLQRFFKTGPGEYGAGDIFLGIKLPAQRAIAERYVRLSLPDIAKLLRSEIHEHRMVALIILMDKYRVATPAAKKEIFEFYLAHTKGINNWDLVDLSACKILGDYLWHHPAERRILMSLSNSANLWEKRMAIIATFVFIARGRAAETLVLAKKFLKEEHDLMHKATGWMLREVGKRVSEKKLLAFLDRHVKNMPRTALRYAIEKLDKAKQKYYLAR